MAATSPLWVRDDDENASASSDEREEAEGNGMGTQVSNLPPACQLTN